MATRRRVFSWLGASTVLPVQLATAEETAQPPCRGRRDLARPWRLDLSVTNAGDFNKGEAPPEIWWMLECDSIGQQLKGFEGVEGLGTERGVLAIRPQSDGSLMAQIDLAQLTRALGGKTKRKLSGDILLWRTTRVDFFFDDAKTPDARMRDVDTFRISLFRMSRDFQRKLMAAQILYVNFVIADLGVIQMAFRVSGLDKALDLAPGMVETHRKTLVAAGGCKASGGCMMTTAAVGMLGRADDCFELAQMRKLRAAFGHETEVLAAYLAASRAVLARLPSRAVAARILLFYALAVWPTALLTRVGALKAARRWYLAGFALIMGRMAAGGARGLR